MTTYTQQRYRSLWNQRAVEYNQKVAVLEQDLANEFGSFQASLARTPVNQDDITAQLLSLAGTLSRLSTAHGKALMLTQFNEFRQTAPMWGMVGVWVKEKAEKLIELDRQSQERYTAFLAAFTDRSKPYPNWLADAESVIRERGVIIGASDELVKLYRELEGYASDLRTAGDADYLRYQQALRAYSLYLQSLQQLQQYSYQQQLLNALNRPRTCIPVGMSVTCY